MRFKCLRGNGFTPQFSISASGNEPLRFGLSGQKLPHPNISDSNSCWQLNKGFVMDPLIGTENPESSPWLAAGTYVLS